MSKIYCGVDIGADGAVAMLINDELIYQKLPKVGKTKEFDMGLFVDFITDNLSSEDTIHVVLEDLHSVHKSSAKSNFSFGFNNGLIFGALQSIRIPHTKVSPKVWQKEMWTGIRPVMIPVKGEKNKDGTPKQKVDTKATSLIAVKRLFPQESFLATERSKVPHDGIVDAVLMCEFCRRKF